LEIVRRPPPPMENQDAQPTPPPSTLVARGNEKSGVVKKWITDRGFGFISSNGEDIFCHITALKPEGSRTELNIGENVVFEVGQDERTGKNRAENVRGEGNGTPPEPSSNSRNRGRGRGRYRDRGRGYNRNGGNDRYSNRRSNNSYNSGGYQSRSDTNQNWRNNNPQTQFNPVPRQQQYGQYGTAQSNTYTQFPNQYQGQAPATYYTSPNPQQFGMQQQTQYMTAAQQYSTRNADNTMPAAYQRIEEDVRAMKLYGQQQQQNQAQQATFPQQQQAQTPQAPNTPQAAQAQPASSFTPVQTQQPAPQIPAQPAYTSSATFGQGSFQQVTGQPGTFQQN